MDQVTKDRLSAVISRKMDMEREIAARKHAEQLANADREAKRKDAEKRWQQSLREINAAISVVNAEIKDHNLRFAIEDSHRDVSPAIAQLCIELFEGAPVTAHRIVLNVSALGHVHSVFVAPGGGRSPVDFRIQEANEDFYAKLLINYLEQVFPKKN